MRRSCSLAVLSCSLLLAGCFHQVVRTGAPPGTVVIERPWTATYVAGLIPATPINTAAQCPAGVAIVETQQSLLNSLVGALTLGIYTPQTVRITCAAAGSAMRDAHEIHVSVDATPAERVAAVREAIELAQRTGEAVLLYSDR